MPHRYGCPSGSDALDAVAAHLEQVRRDLATWETARDTTFERVSGTTAKAKAGERLSRATVALLSKAGTSSPRDETHARDEHRSSVSNSPDAHLAIAKEAGLLEHYRET